MYGYLLHKDSTLHRTHDFTNWFKNKSIIFKIITNIIRMGTFHTSQIGTFYNYRLQVGHNENKVL